ncbi:MAG: hypothetical protein ACLQIB_29330 [Isosphaeraceae bacterium]
MMSHNGPITPAYSSLREASWERTYDEVESVLVLAILGLFYFLALSHLAGFAGRELNEAVFLATLSVLPFTCAIGQLLLSASDRRGVRFVQFVNHWTLIPGLIALAATAVWVQMASAGADAWRDVGYKVLLMTVAAHILAIGLGFGAQRLKLDRDLLPTFFARRAVQIASFALAFFVAAVELFSIEPGSGYPGYVIRSIWAITSPTQGSPLGAWPWAAGIVIVTLVLSRLDRLFLNSILNSRATSVAVALIIPTLLGVLYFDFSLTSDPYHYLAYLGPALHLKHGGLLMVDTFSQYGPGPVAAVWAVFNWGTVSFGSANLLVQAFNLLFYTFIVLCAFLMSGARISAAWLIVVLVPVVFAGWATFNAFPSASAFRYLPALMMVTSLAFLKPPARRSWTTFLATCVAAAWSIEALVGTLGIHLAFVTLLNFRMRAWGRTVADWLFAAFPAILTIGLNSLATRIGAGQWTDYGTYLMFLKWYIIYPNFWAYPADGLSWCWVAMILPLVLVLSDACVRILRPRRRLLPLNDEVLFYRFVPMGGFLAVTGSYFAGRAVDYTVVIAFLPFCAIVVPAFLKTVDLCSPARPVSVVVAVVPVLAIWCGLTVALAIVYRAGSSYDFLVHECRDRGRCSPASLGQSLQENISFRPWLDRPEPDDKHVVADAVRLIERWAADQAEPIVLLGVWAKGAGGLSDVALMYTGKWHRWPRSAYTDQFNEHLLARILAAPVSMREGEVAIVRRDLDDLEPMERAIWDKVRAFGRLCELPSDSSELTVYRLSNSEPCEPIRP